MNHETEIRFNSIFAKDFAGKVSKNKNHEDFLQNNCRKICDSGK